MMLMVFAVQCPNPKCRKYMLVEERDREREIVCLLCKNPFRIEDESRPVEEGKEKSPGDD
jgi:uncharacterized protein YbaR (Trm112 family)